MVKSWRASFGIFWNHMWSVAPKSRPLLISCVESSIVEQRKPEQKLTEVYYDGLSKLTDWRYHNDVKSMRRRCCDFSDQVAIELSELTMACENVKRTHVWTATVAKSNGEWWASCTLRQTDVLKGQQSDCLTDCRSTLVLALTDDGFFWGKPCWSAGRIFLQTPFWSVAHIFNTTI